MNWNWLTIVQSVLLGGFFIFYTTKKIVDWFKKTGEVEKEIINPFNPLNDPNAVLLNLHRVIPQGHTVNEIRAVNEVREGYGLSPLISASDPIQVDVRTEVHVGSGIRLNLAVDDSSFLGFVGTTKIYWKGPSEQEFSDPRFEAIWQIIKSWDINVPTAYAGYCGANGNHCMAILDALNAISDVPKLEVSEEDSNRPKRMVQIGEENDKTT